MKDSTHGSFAGAFILAFVIANSALAAEKKERHAPKDVVAPTPLAVEVLSQTVSKLTRDQFGNVQNPFSGFTFWGRDAVESGVVILAGVVIPKDSDLRLLSDKCHLVSFTDDLGTDLIIETTNSPTHFPQSSVKALEILGSRSNMFGLRIRSTKLPAPEAKQLTAVVHASFVRTNEEQVVRSKELKITTNSAVTLGPIQVKFRHAPTSETTNAPPNSQVYWPRIAEQGAILSSLVFTITEEDEPLLNLRNLNGNLTAISYNGNTYSYSSSKTRNEGGFIEHPYNLVIPDGKRVVVKARYVKSDAYVEYECRVTTGLSP